MLNYEDAMRQQKFNTAWDFYRGRSKKPLNPVAQQGQTSKTSVDNNVIIDYPKLIVDTAIKYLFGGDVGFELDKNTDAAAVDFLSETWRENKKMSKMLQAALDGAVTGMVFLKIQKNAPYPKVKLIDPGIVRPIFTDDDIDEVEGFEIRTSDIKRQIIQRISPNSWKIEDQASEDGGKSWLTTVSDDWNYPFPPVVYCQNLPLPHSFWGLADIEPHILDLCQRANLVASNTNTILTYHAHPKTIVKGTNPKEIEMRPDNTIVFGADKADMKMLEMQSDLGSSNNFLDKLYEQILSVSETPEVTTGKLHNLGRLSGIALKVLYSPLQRKILIKHMLYGDMLVELNRRLLAVGGYGDKLLVKINWPDIIPSDPLTEVAAAQGKLTLGVSQATLLGELGYNAETEVEKSKANVLPLLDKNLDANGSGQGGIPSVEHGPAAAHLSTNSLDASNNQASSSI